MFFNNSKNEPKKNVKGSKKKKLVMLTGTAALIVCIILYMLAYRYLIERVEAKVSNSIGNTSTVGSSSSAEYDKWNYKSDSVDIGIKEMTKGTGSDKVTYFVADVKLKDVSSLHSAFAKNAYGRNLVETTSDIADGNDAIFAINGDYYGFRGDGVLIRNGILYRDNPARIGAAFYSNGEFKTFDENKESSQKLLTDGVTNTLSFGPVLVSGGTPVKDFDNVMVDNNFGNRSIQGLNPRTGVGIIEPNHFVFIVVDGRSNNYSRGMTLAEFAQVFADLGCKEAYNLDGGGSSTMYFMGRVVNNPLGEGNERKISDILYIK